MFKNLSLRHKVPLRTAGLILIVSVVVASSLLLRAFDVFKQDLLVSSENMGRTLARSLTSALLHDDVWKAYEVINTPFSTKVREGALQPRTVIVLDTNRQIYVSTEPKQYPMLTELADESGELTVLGEVFDTQQNGQLAGFQKFHNDQLYAVTSVESDGVVLGTLVMVYSREIFTQRFATFALQAGFTTLVIIAVLVPIGVYWGRHLAGPLVELSGRMSQVGTSITEGRLSRALKQGSNDEIDQLMVQFQSMIEQLQEKEGLEKQMLDSDRLAAIGRFTAGIAHEINNPLGGLLNATNTLRRHGPKDELTEKTTRLLERGLLQIKDTVAALLVEAKADEHALTPQDIEDTRTLVMPQAAEKRANFSWRNEVLGEVGVPATMVRQILINLLLNAIHAIPPQGTVSCWVTADDGYFKIITQNEGEQIDEKRMAVLFEPFVGGAEQGRGLGLWVTYQLVDNLKGEIEVSSGPDDTQFTVTLPIRKAA